MVRVSRILKHIYPDKDITVLNDIDWKPSANLKDLKIQGNLKVSKKILNQAKSDILAEEKRNEYKTKRTKEYPEIKDQLDMLYHDMKNGTKNWISAIEKVKLKYPKSN